MQLSIRLKIICLVVLLVALFGAAEWFATRSTMATLEQTHGERMADTAEAMFNQIGVVVTGRIEELLHLVDQPLIRETLEPGSELATLNPALFAETVRRIEAGWRKQDGSPGTKMQALLDNPVSTYLEEKFIQISLRLTGRSIYSELILTDDRGLVVGATGPTTDYLQADELWWVEAWRKGWFVSGVVYDDSSAQYGLEIAVRMDVDGRPVGVVKGLLSAGWVSREAAAATQLRSGGEIKLVSENGQLIYSNKPFNFFDDVSQVPYFRLALGSRGYVRITEGLRERLYAYARSTNVPAINNLNWILFLSNDRRVILDDAYDLQARLFAAYAIFITLAILIAVFLARSLVRPLQSLELVAKHMGKGDMTARFDVQSNDEIGRLGKVFNLMAERVQNAHAELEKLAGTDPLTGIDNRRQFMRRAEAEMERCLRHGHVASFLALDIDHFKNINDSHGHAIGDAVLKHFVKLIEKDIRTSDIFGRMGGEEFSLVLAETPAKAAAAFADRLRASVAKHPCIVDGHEISVTTSIGVATTVSGEVDLTQALKRSDDALYEAKRSGRNRVCVAE